MGRDIVAGQSWFPANISIHYEAFDPLHRREFFDGSVGWAHPGTRINNGFSLHFRQLSLHRTALLFGIIVSDPNSHDTDASSGPQSKNLRKLPRPMVFAFGFALCGMAVFLLALALRRGGGIGPVAAIVGFIPFGFGVFLLIDCILVAPVPFFGFIVGH